MPRKSAPPACPAAPHVIHPTAVYDLIAARAALGLAKGTLSREIRLGRLRISARAGKRYILGSWILEWLQGGEIRRGNWTGANGDTHAATATN
jgi:hypothetical protein